MFTARRNASVLLFGTAVGLSWAGSAQLTLSSSSGDEPYAACHVRFTDGSKGLWATGTFPNRDNATERFRHQVEEYGRRVGKRMYSDCVTFDDPNQNGVYHPGYTYTSTGWGQVTVQPMEFIPSNWAELPTPKESEKPPADVRRQSPENGRAGAEAAARARAEAKARADAEWERKLSEHKASVEQYQAQLRAVEKEKARQAAEHSRNRATAAAAKARHEAELARHKAELAQQETLNRAAQEAYQRRLKEHQDLLSGLQSKGPQCRMQAANYTLDVHGKTEQEARSTSPAALNRNCTAGTVRGSVQSCRYITPTNMGKLGSLGFDRPWVCSYAVSCQRQVCESKAAAGSRQ